MISTQMRFCLIRYFAILICLFLTDSVFFISWVRAEQFLDKVIVNVNENKLATMNNNSYLKFFGVNYFRPNTGWAPNLWLQFDLDTIEKDFRILHDLGFNCVRLFITYRSFFWTGENLDENGMAKLQQVIKAADHNKLYLIIVGLSPWEGVPEWAKGDQYADDSIIKRTILFWELMSDRLKGNHTVLAFDLINEPVIAWDTEALRKKWMLWQKENNKDSTENLSTTNIPIDSWSLSSRDVLLKYQMFREFIAHSWVQKQSHAIKLKDPDRLITIGLLQTSIPINLGSPAKYTAFRPDRIASSLDIMQIHLYPNEGGWYQYQSGVSYMRNLGYLKLITEQIAKTNKPLIIGEFGWYGGGQAKMKHTNIFAYATEEQQADWGQGLINVTKEYSSGWINWGMYDIPEANDVSIKSGIFHETGEIKKWGILFSEIARKNISNYPIASYGELSEFPWVDAMTIRNGANEYKERYIKKFK